MLPFHPSVVHFPVVIAAILPLLILSFLALIKTQKSWLIIIGLHVLVTCSGYLALETGEVEEDAVSKVVDKKFIHEHEEAAEIFVGASVIALVVAVMAYFMDGVWQSRLRIVTLILSLFTMGLGLKASHLGGGLVYDHGAGQVYGGKK